MGIGPCLMMTKGAIKMNRYLPTATDHGFAVIDTATAQRCFSTDTQCEANAVLWANALNLAYAGFLRAKEEIK